MDAMDCLRALGTNPVTSISQDVVHLPKGGDLD